MYVRYLRLVVAPFTLTLCFVLFLINDQLFSGSGAASGAERSKPLPTLAGDAAADHLKREGIYDRLMKSIEEDRYRITASNGTSFSAINSAQYLRAEFGRDGVLLSPMQKSAQSESRQQPARLGSRQKSSQRDWQMRMNLIGYGYGDSIREVASRLTRTDGNRIETVYVGRANERPALSEWHVNKREGIEHGFTITEKPGVNLAGEPLRVKMKVEGDLEARLADQGGAVVFVRKGGREVLRYDHLAVEDAMGRRLDAWMEAGGGEVTIVVDEAAAAYPLTIDPIFTPVKKLTVDDVNGLGTSVSISGDTVVVGAVGYNSAYIFERNEGGPDQWGQVARLSGSSGFGHSVSISNDTVVVGTSNRAAYIFERNEGGPDKWGQVVGLTGGLDFGHSVSISNDTLAIGDPNSSAVYIYERNEGGPDKWGQVRVLSGPTGLGSSVSLSNDTLVAGSLQGSAACVYERNKNGPDMWGQVQTLSGVFGFGRSVSISNDTLIVGSPLTDGNKGAAYIYERNKNGPDMWGQVGELAGEGGRFGDSVSISNDTIVVGASQGNAAYIYARNKNGPDMWGQVQKLTAEGGQLGYSVSISNDTVVVGAPFVDSNKGAAYTYTIECDEWIRRSRKSDSSGEAGDQFGHSVAISFDTVVVGAPYADNDQGAVYIYERNTNEDGPEADPKADAWGPVKKLTGEGGQFGQSVAISFDTIVVGAPSADTGQGAIYIYARNKEDDNEKPWGLVMKRTGDGGGFGSTVAISFDRIVVGAPGADDDQGAVYIYERNKGEDEIDPAADDWGRFTKLEGEGGEFGSSVAISFDRIVVGAPLQSGGAAYIYERNTSENGPEADPEPDAWGLVKQLTGEGGEFGRTVAVSFDTVVVGAPLYLQDPIRGAAYIYERNTSENGPSDPPDADAWGLVKRLTGRGGEYGHSVAISFDTFVVGARGSLADESGVAYIYVRDCDTQVPCAEMPEGLPPGEAGIYYSQSVAADPPAPYTYELINGTSLPPGLSLDEMSGEISGTPASPGTYTFTVRATTLDGCSVTQSYTLEIACLDLLLDPMSLAAGTAGVAYSASLVAEPVNGYYYSLIGGMLPPGLSLHPTTGLISGLTKIPGSYTFTVRAQHQNGCIITQSYTLEIECPEITLSPENSDGLPDGAVGTSYSATVSATPATTSYTYSVTSGSLPPGLTLNATTGKISGKPTMNGEFTFRVTAQGFGSCSGSQEYRIRIGSDACPTITLPPLPDGQVGKVYSQSVAASPAGTYSYTVSGNLPPGVTFYNTIGLLYGYPTVAGPYTFTITAKTGSTCMGSMPYAVTINGK